MLTDNEDRAPFSQPPAYDDVVERFGIDILKAPGDLVLKDGDLALTKSGDLMLNNAGYSAMFRLVQGWRYNAPTLQSLFDLVVATKKRRKDLEESANRVFLDHRFNPASSNPLAPDEHSIARYHQLNDEIGASELAVSAYAATVVLVLTDLLLRFKDDLDATGDEWEKSAPLTNPWMLYRIHPRSRREQLSSPRRMGENTPSDEPAARLNSYSGGGVSGAHSDGRCRTSIEPRYLPGDARTARPRQL